MKTIIYQSSISSPVQVCTTIHRQECAPITKQHCTVADEPICDTVYEVKNIMETGICWQVPTFRMCAPLYQSQFARQVTRTRQTKFWSLKSHQLIFKSMSPPAGQWPRISAALCWSTSAREDNYNRRKNLKMFNASRTILQSSHIWIHVQQI